MPTSSEIASKIENLIDQCSNGNEFAEAVLEATRLRWDEKDLLRELIVHAKERLENL